MITPSFKRGALILRDDKGLLHRLSWHEHTEPGSISQTPEPGSVRRALPAGKYMLVGYRILRRDDGGREWHVSASAPKLRVIEVTAGESQLVEVDDSIVMRRRINGKMLGFAIRGDSKTGLSIYREGKRIPMGYNLKAAGGRSVRHGKFNYG